MALLAMLVVAGVSALRVSAEREIAQEAVADADAMAEGQGEILRILEPTYRAEQDTSSTAAPPPLAVVDQTIEAVEAAYAERPDVLAGQLLKLGTTLYFRGEIARADDLFERALSLRQRRRREGDGVVRNALIGRPHLKAGRSLPRVTFPSDVDAEIDRLLAEQ